MPLKSQVQELEPNKVALVIEVGEEKVREAYSHFFSAAAREAAIPGFRKGKVPRPVLEKHIGKEKIEEEITEILVKDAYPEAVREHKLVPVSEAQVEEAKLEEGKAFSFKAIVEIKPTLAPFDYKGFSARVKKAIVDDEKVQKTLKVLQEQYAKTKPVEDRGLQDGDYLLANIEASVEGQIDADLSQDKKYLKFATSDKVFAPLAGVKTGETRSFSHLLDGEDEKEHKHFGKTVDYKVTIERISAPQLPELNDEFAKECSEFATLDELKTKIRSDLDQHCTDEANGRAVGDLLKQICGKVEIQVPEAMVQRTIDVFLRRIDQRWRQYGTSLEEYLRKVNKDVKEYREGFRPQALEETKVMLVLEAVGEREEMSVSDAEYRAEVERMAKQYGQPPERMLEILGERKAEDGVREELLDKKIREFLLKNNEIQFDMVNEQDLQKGEDER